MTLLRILLATLAISLALAPASLALDASSSDIVARFEGTSERTIAGHAVMVVGVTAIGTGKTAAIPIPNTPGAKGPAAEPKKELADVVSKLTAGQIVKISVEPNKELGTALATIEAYDLKPGEDTPNGYVFSKTFDKTVGKNTITTVVLTKYGVEHTFTIAMHKGDTGQEQDPDVVASIAKLTEGGPVWVQTQGKSVITAIEPYTPPQTGKVTKISETEVDSHKVKTAEIDTEGGKSVTVYVPGKEVGKAFVADTIVSAQLAKVKMGSQVEFRVHEDGDKLWLREIEVEKPSPKRPVEKEKPPAPAKK